MQMVTNCQMSRMLDPCRHTMTPFGYRLEGLSESRVFAFYFSTGPDTGLIFHVNRQGQT
jgi:hypothetical protein